MTMPGHHSVQRFIRVARRRLGMVQVIEATGLCIAIGAAVSLGLMAVLIWQGEPTARMGFAILGLSLVTGAMIGIARWPSELTAAMRADEQLRFNDLLSTAMTLDESSDGFARTVVALAAARVSQISPSELVWRRLGARTWVSAGLLTALAGIVAFAGQSADAGNRTHTNSPFLTQAELQDNRNTETHSKPQLTPTKPTGNPTENPSKNELGSSEASEQIAYPNPLAHPENPNSPSAGSNHDGASGSAETDSESLMPHPPTGSALGHHSPDGTAANGSGSTSSSDDPGNPSGTTRNQNPQITPPWRSGDWLDAQNNADRAIKANQIPPPYHDLVRDYFRAD